MYCLKHSSKINYNEKYRFSKNTRIKMYEINTTKKLDKRRISFSVDREGGFYEFSVSHRDGGANFATYKHEPRGIELVISDLDFDGICTTYKPLDPENMRILLIEYKRYNKNKLIKVSELVKEKLPDIIGLYVKESRDLNKFKNKLFDIKEFVENQIK